MPALPFPKHSSPGALPSEGGGRRINGYIEFDGERDRVRRAAGLTGIVDTGKSAIRGSLLVNDTLYVVYTGAVVTISAGNVVTTLSGSIPGTDTVTLARNNRTTGGASTPDVVVVREGGGAYVLTTSNVAPYPSANLPTAVNSVEFFGGYLMFTVPDGRIFASELNSTTVSVLSVTTAEARADGLLRGVAIGSIYYAMGASTIEPYQNVGTQPFPLQRAQTVIPVGLKAAGAVAGLGEGWDRPAVFVASDGTVRLLTGFDATTISTPQVVRFVAASPAAELDAAVYTLRDHAFWTISSSLGTWEYDLTRQEWAERQSGGQRWRGSKSVKRGADWVLGDRLSGYLCRVDDTRQELGAPMTWTIESGALKEFPARFAVPSLLMDFTKAAGAAVVITYSIDGGTTWLGPFLRPLDDADRFPVRVNRLGLSTQHGVRVRAVVSSDADISFAGGTLESGLPGGNVVTKAA